MKTALNAIHVELCATLAEGVEQLNKRTGVEHCPFVDVEWSKGPAGSVDLFHEFSRFSGSPIDMHESVIHTGDGVLAIYMVPTAKVSEFVEFLSMIAIELADGSVAAPTCSPPGQVDWHPATTAGVRSTLSTCYVINGRFYPANHPAVAVLKAQTDALKRQRPN